MIGMITGSVFTLEPPRLIITAPNQELYASGNLSGHIVAAECNPGGGTSCPCSLTDVQVTSHLSYGEVTSNPRRTNTWVNAIGYKAFRENFPSAPLSLNTYTYRAEVRLPTLPKPSITQLQNPEAVHLMIQFWDGRNGLWPADKRTLEGAIYWNLNPWTVDAGAVKVYTFPTVLTNTGLNLRADTNWHSFELTVDLVSRKYISLRVDGRFYDLSSVPLAQVSHPDWGSELALNITTESMAAWPGASCANIFSWTTQFRNLAFVKVLPELSWSGSAGKSYKLETSQDIVNWSELPGLLSTAGAIPLSSTGTMSFYRLREQSP